MSRRRLKYSPLSFPAPTGSLVVLALLLLHLLGTTSQSASAQTHHINGPTVENNLSAGHIQAPPTPSYKQLAAEHRSGRWRAIMPILLVMVLLVVVGYMIRRNGEIKQGKTRIGQDEDSNLTSALRQSENRIVLTDIYGRIAWLNKALDAGAEPARRDLQDWVGREMAEFSIHPEIQEVIARVVASKRALNYETSDYDEKGNKRWTFTTVSAILDADGELSKLMFVDVDDPHGNMGDREASPLSNTSTNDVVRFRVSSRDEAIALNEAGETFLAEWEHRNGRFVDHKAVEKNLNFARELKTPRDITLERAHRIFHIEFLTVASDGSVEVAASDITETGTYEGFFNTGDEAAAPRAPVKGMPHRANQGHLYEARDKLSRFFGPSFIAFYPGTDHGSNFASVMEPSPGSEYFIALARCMTEGKGNPMVAVLVRGLLTEILADNPDADPANLLQNLDTEVFRALRQKNSLGNDLSIHLGLAKINLGAMRMEFAGAGMAAVRSVNPPEILSAGPEQLGLATPNKVHKYVSQSLSIAPGEALYIAETNLLPESNKGNSERGKVKSLLEHLVDIGDYTLPVQGHYIRNALKDRQLSTTDTKGTSLLGLRFPKG